VTAADAIPFLYGMACIFGAAVVRGYSGFGFSLLAITSLSLMLDPVEIVPAIFMIEVAISLHLLPGIWREIHWRSVGLLLLGCVVATPAGVWLLATVPAAPMKVALAVIVVVAAALLARGFALRTMPGRAATVATGGVSGLLNGALGIAGPPVILFFFSSPAGVAVGRASVIAYFLGTDTLGLAFLAREDLITTDHLIRAATFLPATLAGVWLGARSFKGADPTAFRRWVLRLLMLLAVLTGAQGAYELWGA